MFSIVSDTPSLPGLAPFVDPWTLCGVMGWSDVKIAMRYIHPSEDHVLAAIEGLQRKSGSRTSSSPIELDFPMLGTGELTPAQ